MGKEGRKGGFLKRVGGSGNHTWRLEALWQSHEHGRHPPGILSSPSIRKIPLILCHVKDIISRFHPSTIQI